MEGGKGEEGERERGEWRKERGEDEGELKEQRGRDMNREEVNKKSEEGGGGKPGNDNGCKVGKAECTEQYLSPFLSNGRCKFPIRVRSGEYGVAGGPCVIRKPPFNLDTDAHPRDFRLEVQSSKLEAQGMLRCRKYSCLLLFAIT